MLLANMVADAFKVSTSEARRKIVEGAVRINDQVCTRDPDAKIFFAQETWILQGSDVLTHKTGEKHVQL